MTSHPGDVSPVISVIVPTMGRPGRLAGVAADIAGAATVPYEVLMVAEPGDKETIAAVRAIPGVRLVLNARSANYAGAVNTAVPLTRGRYLFTGSDDLRFHPGWDSAVLGVMTRPVMAGGTNDLLNPYVLEGRHATHYLVDRHYVIGTGGVFDQGPGVLLQEAYDHGFTDCEFIGTAKSRGVFAPCLASVAEHLHFESGKSARDATYARGQRARAADEALFRSREPMWADVLSGAL